MIEEQELTEELLDILIRLSADWEAENSCYGYRKNEKADIEGNRIFIAKDGEDVIGYLFGYLGKSERSTSIMPDGTPVFEVEELYVKPDYRHKGIGKMLFAYAESAVRNDADYIMLSTATKNWRAIFHFYLDELGMEFWSARLFKKVGCIRNRTMITAYKPALQDLWFRQQFMADEATMSYNAAWGGTIPFPENEWREWYDYWLIQHENKRFYRYLKDSKSGGFVGEIAYHYDEEREIWLADVIVASKYRGKGFGAEGLRLLCEAAAANGIDALRDNIAINNPAVSLFLKAGFTEEYRTEEIIMLKKDLRNSPEKNHVDRQSRN